MWFAWEPKLQPPVFEGRVIELDDKCRVQYRHPGPMRKYIVDLTAELAAGTARVLFNTRTEHVQSRPSERLAMNMSDVLIGRCWHMLAEPATSACSGCGTPSHMCALCQSALSRCCISINDIHTLDVLSALPLQPAVTQCQVMSTSTQALLWEIRARRADTLCVLCNEWLAQREGDASTYDIF